ncbi:MAG TPA: GNAT family N-acetyltransferase [Steroidobacteraceae bacterium]|nr:GNAT family N-acetyltransferase [Steroidobacteraceae bacterium]
MSRSSSPAAGEVRILESLEAFDALEDAWRALDAAPGLHPFQEFGWLSAWAHTIGRAEGWQLRIATLWQRERLIAALPLAVQRFKGLKILEWLAARVSDYCDALVAPGVARHEALGLLWRSIQRRGGFDVARLRHVRADAHIAATLDALQPWIETLEDAGGVPIAWPSGDAWYESQSTKMRERVRYKARRMQSAGFRVELIESAGDLDGLIDVLVAQKRPWLAERGLTSMIDAPAGVAFLKRAVSEAARRGELHLSVVRNDERIAACDLAFVREGRIYSYIASFDAEYAKYSFGRLLTDRLLMWACDTGQRRLDLLLGAYDYKSEYQCTLEPVRTLVLGRTVLGRLAVILYRRRTLAARLKSGAASP